MPLLALVLVTGLHCTACAETWSLIAAIYADGDLRQLGPEYAANLEDAAEAAGWPLALQLDSGDDSVLWRAITPGQAPSTEVVSTDASKTVASPGPLSDFLAWARERAQADRYALVVYGHGNSASGRRWDGTQVGAWPTLAIDVSASNDPLEPAELASAIEQGLQAPADLIVLDCCYGASLEVAWELRDAAACIVASPGKLRSGGLRWRAMLPAVSAGDDANAAALEWARVSGQSLSVVRTDGLDELGAAVSRLASVLAENMPDTAPLLTHALSKCSSWGSELEMRDLGTLCDALATGKAPEVAGAADETLQAANRCLMTEGRGITVPVAGGLGGAWPSGSPSGFTEASGWGDMTRAYSNRLRQLLQLTGHDRRHDGAAT